MLEFAGFDAGAFAADLDRVAALGITISSFTELRERVPDAELRLHELSETLGRDVPSPDAHCGQDFEVWRRRVIESPRFMPACTLIALDGERWVGMSTLWGDEAPGRLQTGLTGVRREYRRRGIATALKVRAIEAGKALGYERTITWNEEKNRGMLGINLRLGFRLRPAWISVEKVLDAEALAAETAREAAEATDAAKA
jgi:GNAT superfamily N-acetyltransferase